MDKINPGLALAWRSHRVRGVLIAIWNDHELADDQEEAEYLRSHVMVRTHRFYATIPQSDWDRLGDEEKIHLVCEAGDKIAGLEEALAT